MEIKISVRLVIIHDGKVLLINNERDDFYYFIGGGIEQGETLDDASNRELQEESGYSDILFEFEKILYIHEMVFPERHKLEIFIKGSINKFEELEGVKDPTHDGYDHLTWVEIKSLPENLLPHEIAQRIAKDFENNFEDIDAPLITRREPSR